MTGYSVILVLLSSMLGRGPAGPDRSPKAEVVLDLNTATLGELLDFKGIGRMYAEKIYQGRPFRARAELVDRHILPTTIYLAIKHHLYTSPIPAESAAAADPVPAGMVDLNRTTWPGFRGSVCNTPTGSPEGGHTGPSTTWSAGGFCR